MFWEDGKHESEIIPTQLGVIIGDLALVYYVEELGRELSVL